MPTKTKSSKHEKGVAGNYFRDAKKIRTSIPEDEIFLGRLLLRGQEHIARGIVQSESALRKILALKSHLKNPALAHKILSRKNETRSMRQHRLDETPVIFHSIRLVFGKLKRAKKRAAEKRARPFSVGRLYVTLSHLLVKLDFHKNHISRIRDELVDAQNRIVLVQRNKHASDRNRRKSIASIEEEIGDDQKTIFAANRLIRRGIREIDHATTQLTEKNLRLVVKIAAQYATPGVQILDLIQEGNIGLMTAAERFDYTRGNTFSTLASPWIRQAISKNREKQARTIHVPQRLLDKAKNIEQIQRDFEQMHGRTPTIPEIAESISSSLEEAERARTLKSHKTISIETPVNREEDISLARFIQDKTTPTPEDALRRKELKQKITPLLKRLDEREEKIVRMRFGMEPFDHEHALQEASVLLHLSRERIRQIGLKALEKLRRDIDKLPA